MQYANFNQLTSNIVFDCKTKYADKSKIILFQFNAESYSLGTTGSETHK